MRKVSLFILIALASFAAPRTWMVPHILEKGGLAIGTIYDVQGGYHIKGADGTSSFSPVTFTPSDTHQLLREVSPLHNEFGGVDAARREWSIHRVEHVAGGLGASLYMNMPTLQIGGIEFPECGPNTKEAPPLKIRVINHSVGWVNSVRPLPGRDKDKPFLMDVPDVQINGVNMPDVTVGEFKIRVEPDFDSDGTIDFHARPTGHLELTFPQSSRIPVPNEVKVRVTYRSTSRGRPAFSTPAISLDMTGRLVSDSPFDQFSPPADTDASGVIHWALEVRVDRIEMK